AYCVHWLATRPRLAACAAIFVLNCPVKLTRSASRLGGNVVPAMDISLWFDTPGRQSAGDHSPARRRNPSQCFSTGPGRWLSKNPTGCHAAGWSQYPDNDRDRAAGCPGIPSERVAMRYLRETRRKNSLVPAKD